MSHCTSPEGITLPPPQQLNFFPNTTPRLNKYTGVISGLLRNIPPREVLSNNSAFNLADAVHDNETIDVYLSGREQAGLRGPIAPSSSMAYDMELLSSLCVDAKRVLEEEAVVLQIVVGGGVGHTSDNESEDDELVIVGDIHGQFRDMQKSILSVQLDRIKSAADGLKSKPKKDCTFLFLGDYVDRGPQGVEVISLLLALKVEYPSNIYLLRGNHEVAQVCKIYGFLSECQSKLDCIKKMSPISSPLRSGSPPNGIGLWGAFNNVFTLLPLGATVEWHNRHQKIQMGKNKHIPPSPISFFCCHGGFNPHNNHIEVFQFLNRAEYGQGLISGEDSDVIDGLLWSDPTDDIDDTDDGDDISLKEPRDSDSPRAKEDKGYIGGYQHSTRGCGFIFGPDETMEFCTTNDVQLVVRAHQMVMSGYKYSHHGRILTLFSAPNYCGISNNKGAIAVLKGSHTLNSNSEISNVSDGGVNKIPFDFLVYDVVPINDGPIRIYYQSVYSSNSCLDTTVADVPKACPRGNIPVYFEP
eukprot:Tbor_TRINITY_DN3558_c0_g1::TRINITY_DN3558_c0_g1_i1::g.2819::m.2819